MNFEPISADSKNSDLISVNYYSFMPSNNEHVDQKTYTNKYSLRICIVFRRYGCKCIFKLINAIQFEFLINLDCLEHEIIEYDVYNITHYVYYNTIFVF